MNSHCLLACHEAMEADLWLLNAHMLQVVAASAAAAAALAMVLFSLWATSADTSCPHSRRAPRPAAHPHCCGRCA